MAYSRHFTVTTTRQLIVPVDGSAQEILVHSTGGTVYVGGPDVTVDNGYKMDVGDKETFLVHPGDEIYAITNAGSVQIMMLVLVR